MWQVGSLIQVQWNHELPMYLSSNKPQEMSQEALQYSQLVQWSGER